MFIFQTIERSLHEQLRYSTSEDIDYWVSMSTGCPEEYYDEKATEELSSLQNTLINEYESSCSYKAPGDTLSQLDSLMLDSVNFMHQEPQKASELAIYLIKAFVANILLPVYQQIDYFKVQGVEIENVVFILYSDTTVAYDLYAWLGGKKPINTDYVDRTGYYGFV